MHRFCLEDGELLDRFGHEDGDLLDRFCLEDGELVTSGGMYREENDEGLALDGLPLDIDDDDVE